MTPYWITRALRRDDLALSERVVDRVQLIEKAREPFHDDAVVLTERNDVDESAPEQCLEIFEADTCRYGLTYRFVPLMFGPVRDEGGAR